MSERETPFTRTELAEALYELADLVVADPEDRFYGRESDVEIRESYSGRAMYGAECFGIVHDHGQEMLIGLAIARAVEAVGNDSLTPLEEAARIVRRAQRDSMGRQSITYFPGWTLKPEEPEDPAAALVGADVRHERYGRGHVLTIVPHRPGFVRVSWDRSGTIVDAKAADCRREAGA